MREGLLPAAPATVARVTCDERMARRLAEIISETFDPEEVATAAFEQPGLGADGRPPWLAELFFGEEPDEEGVRALVADVCGPEIAAALVFERLAAKDWVEASLAGLKPVQAGRFLVHGQHDRARVPCNAIGIEIEAALAFGTGHHGTTRGCLRHLEALLKRAKPRAIVDVGTGTGVLAIAAARVLRRPVKAGDVDALAVVTARDNAALNGVGALVRPVLAAGLAHPALAGRYDLILANILARPLRKLAPSLCGALVPGGHLILSGLLPRDVPGVLAAYAAQGFFLLRRLDDDGWASLTLARGGANRKVNREPSK